MSEASPISIAAEAKMHSPRITTIAWGRIEVEGVGTFRDAKLFPGGAREWDWRETGTEHAPGIQPADVRELLDHGATTIVLSQGMLKRLGICHATLALLKRQGVRVHVLPTQDAVDIYNDLRKTEQVAGLFHTTC
ncbi:Mth938-like domain-containing protein [Bradyrhizobium sediminis]|uniref:Mth938-like domain-containing protein n=1 Tax=Bradyrhizobium sediminis TaxID=2840469 RepID=A0A975RM78_9BRAD|nr:Mth938-like domain-containing protein [Bradyrhizobium sediminis]QWG13155.1 Mth938-like domain-containing protein [Bradyrhizobium sediminis]